MDGEEDADPRRGIPSVERVLTSRGRVLVGPWCSEVGYELLYWIPFVRWALRAYRVPPSRVVVMSRGRIVAELRGDELDERRIVEAIVGSRAGAGGRMGAGDGLTP